MTLRDLLRLNPSAFYPQTWYLDEPFLDTDVGTLPLTPPVELASYPEPPGLWLHEPFAAHLAALWIVKPDMPMWSKYLWCADVDSQGQRVYVGQNGHGLEIHRHLHLTSRWVIPTW